MRRIIYLTSRTTEHQSSKQEEVLYVLSLALDEMETYRTNSPCNTYVAFYSTVDSNDPSVEFDI